MNRYIPFIFIFFILAFAQTPAKAQKHTITAGFQYKPIFPSKYFSSADVVTEKNGINFTISPRMGYVGGMIIRNGITDQLSFETGINFVQRNYDFSINNNKQIDHSDRFRVVGYEFPLSGLFFVQLGENLFMNTSLGGSIDYFPSDVAIYEKEYQYLVIRPTRFQFSALGNLGWEYRTRELGFFYVGASYHRPFTNIYNTQFKMRVDGETESQMMPVSGNYLTLDFRYFFPVRD
jgi:hypothetical protein